MLHLPIKLVHKSNPTMQTFLPPKMHPRFPERRHKQKMPHLPRRSPRTKISHWHMLTMQHRESQVQHQNFPQRIDKKSIL